MSESPGAGPRSPRSRFVGRANELAAAREALSAGLDVMIDGPPGSGRSRMLEEIIAVAPAATGVEGIDDADHLDDDELAAATATTGPVVVVAEVGGRADVTVAQRRGPPVRITLPPLDADALADLLGAPELAALFLEPRPNGRRADHESAIRAVAAARARGDRSGADSATDRAWAGVVDDDHATAAMVAEAALASTLVFGYVGDRVRELGRRSQAALDRGEHPPAIRARLLARTAMSALGDPAATARLTAERAMSLAIESGDQRATGDALLAYAVTDLGPDSLDERTAMTHRIVAIADELGDLELGALGAFVLMGSLVEGGDISGVDAEILGRSRLPGHGPERHIAWMRAMRAILDGRVDEAESRCTEAFEIGLAEGDADAESVYFGQLGIVRWLQGREVEVEGHYLGALEQQPDAPVWRAVLARLWALDGRHELAAAAVGDLGDLAAIPRDRNWLLTMCVLAEAAATIGDADAARAIRAELLPYANRLVPIGLGIACFGSVARPLGLIARMLGLDQEAHFHLRTAIDVCSAAGARPWLAQAQFDLAALLRERGESSALLEAEAESSARAANVVPLLTGRVGIARSATGGLDGTGWPSVRVLGTFEVRDVEGRRASWTSRKARELLKVLIARRGATVPRSTLIATIWPDEHEEDAANRLSVALSTVRRTIDPERRAGSGRFIGGDGESIWIEQDALHVDVLELLRAGRILPRSGDPDRDVLRAIVDGYRGPAFAEAPDAEWAHDLRLDASAVFLAAARALGRLALDDDPLLAAEVHRRILAEDPYDEGGHLGLVAALGRLGAHGRSEDARQRYYARMAELGITVTDLRGTSGH